MLILTFFIWVLFLGYLAYPIYQAFSLSKSMIANTIPFEQHPMNPIKRVLVAGDSAAVGLGATNPKETVSGRIGQQFSNWDITNLGVSGARLKDLLHVLQQQPEKHYDLIVLQIGGNDITHFTPYETIRSELAKVISLSSKLSPKTIILTAGNIGTAPIFRWPLSTIMTGRTLNVRSIFIDEVAKNKAVSYVDLFKDCKDDPFFKYPEKHYAQDKFHLTSDGYGVWYIDVQKKLINK